MSEKATGSRRKPYASALIWGTVSITAYVLVFLNQDLVTDLTTRGKMYAALPIAAAFLFSFVHGAFASYTLSILGIEPKKKK